MMAKTFVDVLRERARRQPDRRIFTFLSGGESEGPTLTYAELDARARAIAARLQGARGERALLLYPPGLEFIEAFFGCLYAGVIAVPAYPPTPPLERSMPRLLAIVHDARPRFILTTAGLQAAAAALAPADAALSAAEWVPTDEIESKQDCDGPALVPSSVAFLQYTSGSTRTPRGVVVTHGNLLENSALIQRALGVSESTRSVSWLPLYHDMGLIGGIVQPVYTGCSQVLMSPLDFLQRPLRWLRAIARYQATASGGPNFGYELCVRKSTPEERAALDLSSWELAFDGAEPVRPDTLARFAEAFAVSGFRPQAFFPCYGLAEATLFVSGGHVDGTDPAAKIASCGRVAAHTNVAIVDPERWVPLAPGEVGEIWISGPSVAAGYWANPGESLRTFGATLASGEGRFLRTGDLGFLRDGQLFVTGRLKDLIIIRGRNHYPQDIERTVEDSHPAIRRGCCAAFAATIQGEERLVVVAEIERRFAVDRRRALSVAPAGIDRRAGDRRQLETLPASDPHTESSLDPSAIVATVRQQVLAQHGVRVESVILLPAGQIPKTSSGKIQRSACRAAFSEHTLEAIAA
jgi:acyl-CoA synthetase (AMP-forming)/AMP-acid ligase II